MHSYHNFSHLKLRRSMTKAVYKRRPISQNPRRTSFFHENPFKNHQKESHLFISIIPRRRRSSGLRRRSRRTILGIHSKSRYGNFYFVGGFAATEPEEIAASIAI